MYFIINIIIWTSSPNSGVWLLSQNCHSSLSRQSPRPCKHSLLTSLTCRFTLYEDAKLLETKWQCGYISQQLVHLPREAPHNRQRTSVLKTLLTAFKRNSCGLRITCTCGHKSLPGEKEVETLSFVHGYPAVALVQL